jgi:hypothetical protein
MVESSYLALWKECEMDIAEEKVKKKKQKQDHSKYLFL